MKKEAAKKHTHKSGRCSYDEYQYDKELRAEQEASRRVLKEYADRNKALLADRKRLLDALIQTQDLLTQSLGSLRIYREQILQSTEREMRRPDSVSPSEKFGWNTERGWYALKPEGADVSAHTLTLWASKWDDGKWETKSSPNVPTPAEVTG